MSRRQSSKPYKRNIAVYTEDDILVDVIDAYSYTEAIDKVRKLYPRRGLDTLSATNYTGKETMVYLKNG